MRHVNNIARRYAAFLLVVASGAAAACDNYLQISDPSVIDASSLEPARDAVTASYSAQQSFASMYDDLIVHSAWFVGEALVADPQVEPNAFGRRDIPPESQTVTALFRSASGARSLGAEAYRLAAAAGAGYEVHAARAALVAGFSFLFVAEQFCQGVVDGGPPLTTVMMLDSAVAWFGRAITSGRAVTTGATLSDAGALVNAALVGRARAELQAGRPTQAAADASQVAANFDFRLRYIDDAANRGRVGNGVWDLTTRRRVVAVAPAFRNLNDPRVVVNAPVATLTPQDGVTPYWTQGKYPNYGTSIRLASKLEADYILAEAQGTATMLTLVQQRRTANAQATYTGPTDAAAVRAEFLRQRAREFFLEGKTLGDTRRHPGVADYVPATGSAFHKAGFAPIGNQTCYPLPSRETLNNGNFGF